MNADQFTASHLKVKHNSAGEVSITFPLPPNLDRSAPPVNSGTRITSELSKRGAKTIRGAVYIAARDYGGMTTFATATFDEDARNRLTSGETTIGSEVKRFIDAWRSRYRKRGKKPPLFIWVAENPNDSNPHVHILTTDRIEYRHFRMWARGLEKLWGNGMVHLEKIKYPKAAGRYLMKSIGYLAKGTDGSQGTVVGQRYGVSRDLKPKEYIDYVRIGVEALIAFRKLLSEQVNGRFDGIYIHEYGAWAPPGFGMAQLLAWTFDTLLVNLE